MSRGTLLTGGAAVALYLTYDAYTAPSDPDHPRFYPMRRVVRRLMTAAGASSRVPTTIAMTRDESCKLGDVLFHFVESDRYPRDGRPPIAPAKTPPTDPALCAAIDRDTNVAVLGSGSYGYVQPHPSKPADLVYKREFDGRGELKNEAVAMTILNPLKIAPRLVSWCPAQNALVSERMVGTLLEDSVDWSSWSVAAQLRLVHSPMRSMLVQRGKISPQTVLGVYLDLLRALKGIHGANLVHRDVHLGNIMFNPKTKRWLLIDFGLTGAATPTYRSFDLAGLGMAMLSLANLIDLDWPDLVAAHREGTVRWIDAHPCVRFRSPGHKGRAWDRIYGAIRASMTLRPMHTTPESLIGYLESDPDSHKAERKPAQAGTPQRLVRRLVSAALRRTPKKRK